MQVAQDEAFTSIIDNATGLTGTRYSRAISLDNNQYWWRVRAIDLLGQATPWTTSRTASVATTPRCRRRSTRSGRERPPAAVAPDDPYLSWTPVKRATFYEIQMADDQNFSTDVRTCTTALTSYTLFPGGSAGSLPRRRRRELVARASPRLCAT